MALKFRFFPAAAVLALLSACGGGGDLVSETSASDAPSSGLVVDGYLSIAKVVCDTNGNGLVDSGEAVTYTNTSGNYVFRSGCAYGVLASGGINVDTGAPFLGQLRTPAGATVVTPLTTLVAAGMTQDQVINALSLPPDTKLLTTDPAAKDGDVLKNSSLYKKTLAIQAILEKTSSLFSKLAVDSDSGTAAVYAQAASAFAKQLKTDNSLISATGEVSSAAVKKLVAAAVDQVSIASTVPQAIRDAIQSAGGSNTLPSLVDVAFTAQAQAFINAANAEIVSVASALQKNTVVESNIATALKAGTLKSTSTDDEVAAMKVNIALKTQVALILGAEPPSLLVSGQTTLSTTGGSGSGAVTYNITSGACTLSGNTLTAPASPDTCTVVATKASDSIYAAASSAPITVSVTVTFTSTSKLDFERTGRGSDFAWTSFENVDNAPIQIVTNPLAAGINTSEKVIKFTALKTGEAYAGFQSAHGTDLGTVTFSATNALVKLMVYKNVISDVGVKFANLADSSTGEVKVANTKTNEWEQLTFNFCDRVGEVNDRIIFFPDFAARTADTSSYLDNITFNACPPPAPPEPDTAPAVPTALTENVISLYGDGYSTVSGTDTPKWSGVTTTVSTQTYVGNNVMKLSTLNWQGFTNTAPLDISKHTSLHIDFWSQTATTIEVKLVSLTPSLKQQAIFIPVSAGTWISKDIPLSSFTIPDKTKFQQLVIAATSAGRTLYVDNIYFWK